MSPNQALQRTHMVASGGSGQLDTCHAEYTCGVHGGELSRSSLRKNCFSTAGSAVSWHLSAAASSGSAAAFVFTNKLIWDLCFSWVSPSNWQSTEGILRPGHFCQTPLMCSLCAKALSWLVETSSDPHYRPRFSLSDSVSPTLSFIFYKYYSSVNLWYS